MAGGQLFFSIRPLISRESRNEIEKCDSKYCCTYVRSTCLSCDVSLDRMVIQQLYLVIGGNWLWKRTLFPSPSLAYFPLYFLSIIQKCARVRAFVRWMCTQKIIPSSLRSPLCAPCRRAKPNCKILSTKDKYLEVTYFFSALYC